MTSLRELSGKRPIDNEALLDAFLARLEPRYEALKAGRFDAGGWSAAQRTTGRQVMVDLADDTLAGIAVGVDPESGALLVESDGRSVRVDSGEVVRCRVR
jgi:biotin-(acetyl-CoA carboxylase) ligase